MMQRNISEAVRAANVLVRTSETYRVDHNVHGDWRHGSTRSDESSFSPWYVEANKRLFEWNARQQITGRSFHYNGTFPGTGDYAAKCGVGCLKVTIFHGVCDDEESIVRCHSVHAENNLTILGRIGLMMCTPRKHRDQRWK